MLHTWGDTERLRRLWDTVRWLKPRQVYGRLWFRAYRPQPDVRATPHLRSRTSRWVQSARREPSIIGPHRFHILNETRDVPTAQAWDAPDVARLWRYHLHYFDDLNARASASRAEWQHALIQRWLEENPPGKGTGWEPYPVSLRIINWIKWVASGSSLSSPAEQSLAVQARWLCRRLEWHLLGNHLLANAKALVFAGLFFAGAEAEGWLERGLAILAEQLPEQILSDGGHFERSPMYHAIALEDVLDLLNAAEAWPGRVPAEHVAGWRSTAQRMLHWLDAMCHPDGEIALFNDSALGVAPSPAELFAYAARLGLGFISQRPPLEHLAATGYVRIERGPWLLLADVGDIGPDYLPGHAHADSLSFELSHAGERWIVDTGCSTYAAGAERLRQRGTAAHNTVMVDGKSSSEVWSSFRVARRAKARDVWVMADGDDVIAQGAHDGYRRAAGPIHRRRWVLSPRALIINDQLDGPFEHATGYLHLHPEVGATLRDAQTVMLERAGRELCLRAQGASLSLETSSWHPGFNLGVTNTAIVSTFHRANTQLNLEVA